jgi:outer membrane protein insertion porin family
LITVHRFGAVIAGTALAVMVGGCAGSRPPANSPNSFPYPGITQNPVSSAGATMSPSPAAAPAISSTAPAATVSPTAPAAFDTSPAPGSQDHRRYPMPVSGTETVTRGQSPDNTWGAPPTSASPAANVNAQGARTTAAPAPASVFPGVVSPEAIVSPAVDGLGVGPPPVDVDVLVEEARTGRFMFGVGVNSELGVTGQIVIDERNFDWRRLPTSWDDIWNGTAWRGAGQGFRLEAMPGDQVQRYLASFTEPYFYLPGIAEPFSLNLSGFFFNRRYFDWSEERVGGRVGLGYRLTHDLSLTTALRAENVDVYDPRVIGAVPELDAVLGNNDFFSGRVTLTHDTRDTAFAPTEGHMIELSFEQAFGSFDYPRGDLEYHQYFLMRERPDGSGRHTLGYSFQLGFSGAQTPIFENYFAGGFSTLRGFEFRGASPVGPLGIAIGGKFRFLGSVEYMFPLTADDMLKAVVFCDYGTVEESVGIHGEYYRVAPGFGLRIAIPALGPAPLALDLAFPVAKADFDEVQNFSFFLGFTR